MSQHRDPINVLHAVLLKLPGGISAAAKFIGRSPGVMHNKFSEGMPHYEITAREALSLARYSGTADYAEAICNYFGGVFMPLPEDRPGDDDILESYLEIIVQMGELSKEFIEARSDGIIDPDEFAQLRRRAHRTISAVVHMLAEIETTVKYLPPPSPPGGDAPQN